MAHSIFILFEGGGGGGGGSTRFYFQNVQNTFLWQTQKEDGEGNGSLWSMGNLRGEEYTIMIHHEKFPTKRTDLMNCFK